MNQVQVLVEQPKGLDLGLNSNRLWPIGFPVWNPPKYLTDRISGLVTEIIVIVMANKGQFSETIDFSNNEICNSFLD